MNVNDLGSLSINEENVQDLIRLENKTVPLKTEMDLTDFLPPGSFQ
jgi:hypothetical protein